MFCLQICTLSADPSGSDCASSYNFVSVSSVRSSDGLWETSDCCSVEIGAVGYGKHETAVRWKLGLLAMGNMRLLFDENWGCCLWET